MASCRTPAEWMMPTRFGLDSATNWSTAARLLTSHLACSTCTPILAAVFWISRQAGKLSSPIFMERDRNLMVKPDLPCCSAFSSKKFPITRASAPLPPEIATIPLLGISKGRRPRAAYGFAETCLITYRPDLRIRTVFRPSVSSLKTSDAKCGNISSGNDHSVSMYCKGMSSSCLAVLDMPKSTALEVILRPNSSCTSLSSAKESAVMHTRPPLRPTFCTSWMM
mmetsp:Transcript_72783/g.157972  ORF Transcript_72783/g.157972 Transcript_72783/m.157972 type:complete len:224 (+) Transcript_72783:754-1425(+)